MFSAFGFQKIPLYLSHCSVYICANLHSFLFLATKWSLPDSIPASQHTLLLADRLFLLYNICRTEAIALGVTFSARLVLATQD